MKVSNKIIQNLYEDFSYQSDDELEQEVEKYRQSETDKLDKYFKDEEQKHQERLKQFDDEKNRYIADREESLKKYRTDHEMTDDKLNTKREELRKNREESKVRQQKEYEEAKQRFSNEFVNIDAVSDIADKSHPGNWRWGGTDVAFTYGNKSYAVSYYNSSASGDNGGKYQLRWCIEIPNNEVHKGISDKKDYTIIQEVNPEELGLNAEYNYGTVYVWGKINPGHNEPMVESTNIPDYIQLLNRYKEEYSFGYGNNGNDSYIEQYVINTLNDIPDGTTICLNYKDNVSGWTSHGGYSSDYWTILEYTKQGDMWKTPWGTKDVNDMKTTILHSSGDFKTPEQAKKDHEELKKTNKTSHRDYAPSTGIDKDNPYWDGNRYGI